MVGLKPGGWGILPYMDYIGMWVGFSAVLVINRNNQTFIDWKQAGSPDRTIAEYLAFKKRFLESLIITSAQTRVYKHECTHYFAFRRIRK